MKFNIESLNPNCSPLTARCSLSSTFVSQSIDARYDDFFDFSVGGKRNAFSRSGENRITPAVSVFRVDDKPESFSRALLRPGGADELFVARDFYFRRERFSRLYPDGRRNQRVFGINAVAQRFLNSAQIVAQRFETEMNRARRFGRASR